MTIAPSVQWTDDFLNQKRLIGDPLADTTIGTIMSLGLKGELDQLFRQLTQNDSYATLSAQGFPEFSPALVQAVEPFFAESGQLPADLNTFVLNNATDQFSDHLVPILLSLHCKSLPLSYACANGAKVLHQAGRMVVRDKSLKPFTRRLLETAQFVNNLLEKNGFEPAGKAIISVQKVRLMHAAIRYYTKLRPSWDVALYGEPINQEDLALGHLIFSSVIISGLRQFGIDVSANQEMGYLYLWQTVSHILGVQSDVVAQTQADGEYLLQRIMDRQARPSDEGAALTYACIEFVDGKLKWLPIRHLTPRLMRFLIGEDYARMLQIPGTPSPAEQPNPDDFSLIRKLFPKWDSANESNLLLKAVTRFSLSEGLDAGLKAYNDNPQGQFFVPSSLSDYLNTTNVVPITAGPDAQTLADAIVQLDVLTRLLKNQNNPIGLFALACRELTKRIADGIRTNAFANNAQIGDVYLNAVNRFFGEVNRVGKDEAVSGPWRVVFQSDKRLLTIDQHLMLPAFAHIAYDLIRSMADMVPADRLAGFESDYQHIGTLFTEVYMQLIERLGQIHPDYGWLAGLRFEPARETAFATFTTEVARAWEFAALLRMPGSNLAAVQQAHDLAAATVADRIADPADDTLDVLNDLAQRQFPADQPDETVAAKLDALLARDFT